MAIYHCEFINIQSNVKQLYQLAITFVFFVIFFTIFKFDKILKSYAAIKIGERHSPY